MAFRFWSRNYYKRLLRYFEREKGARIPVITEYANLEIDVPDDMSLNEIIGALTLFLFSTKVPATHIYERYKPHPSWKSRFNELFLHNLEEISRDLRVIGLEPVFRKLLKYGQLVAEDLGLESIANQLNERMIREIKGKVSQMRSFGPK